MLPDAVPLLTRAKWYQVLVARTVEPANTVLVYVIARAPPDAPLTRISQPVVPALGPLAIIPLCPVTFVA